MFFHGSDSFFAHVFDAFSVPLSTRFSRGEFPKQRAAAPARPAFAAKYSFARAMEAYEEVIDAVAASASVEKQATRS